MTLALRLWCIGATLALSAAVQKELSCFQCNVTNDAECTSDFLKPCPSDKSYDKCQTRRRQTIDGQNWVEKGCGVSPCELPHPEQVALGLFCDQSAPAYDCVFCCDDNGCNGDAGTGTLVLALLLRLLPLITPLLAIQPYLSPFLSFF